MVFREGLNFWDFDQGGDEENEDKEVQHFFPNFSRRVTSCHGVNHPLDDQSCDKPRDWPPEMHVTWVAFQ